MKIFNPNFKQFLLAITLFSALTAQAEFLVDMNFKGVPGANKIPAWEDKGYSILIDKRNAIIKSEGGGAGGGDMAFARLSWDGSFYYISGTSDMTKAQKDEIHQSTVEKREYRALPNGAICELFLFDSRLKLLARHKVQLPPDNGGPFCNESNAVGRAWSGIPALLYSVAYYQVNVPLVKRAQDIGKNYINSTYLIRLKKEENGSIHFEQDDACLGSRNHFATIAQARKALAKCPIH